MKGFYFSSTLMWDADAETLMRTAAENGFDGIELWAQHAETKKLDLETIRRLKKELGSELRGIKRCGPEGIRGGNQVIGGSGCGAGS